MKRWIEIRGSETMFYRNRGGPVFYSTGCSTIGCLLLFFVFSMLIGQGIVFFFRYFWLIVLLGLVVWLFRKFTGPNNGETSTRKDNTRQNNQTWQREKNQQPGSTYDNISRDFEEVEEDEQNFNDF